MKNQNAFVPKYARYFVQEGLLSDALRLVELSKPPELCLIGSSTPEDGPEPVQGVRGSLFPAFSIQV